MLETNEAIKHWKAQGIDLSPVLMPAQKPRPEVEVYCTKKQEHLLELAEKIFTSLAGRQVIVLGAGETSAKAARALLSRGARSVIVSNRSYDRAQSLAEELKGRAVRFMVGEINVPRVTDADQKFAAAGLLFRDDPGRGAAYGQDFVATVGRKDGNRRVRHDANLSRAAI